MAWTSVGFDGTINEAQWSQMAGLLGNDYVAAGNGDCIVTSVPGARSVSVAAGSLYGDGVVSTNSGAETVAMTTPVNGQWYVIALRRTWATNTAALVAIAGATTTTTTPTAPPTSFPTLNTNKGVLTDQPIAWAWCNSANTTVVVYDIRLKAVKSLPPVVANANERDAKFMTPTQGLQVWRDDLGAVETYFGLYNSSTNPGGRDAAGWYTNDRSTGLVPIKPATVSIATGTGSVNGFGQISFTGATYISITGIFTSEYKNYRVILECVKNGINANNFVNMRFTTGGTYTSTAGYSCGVVGFATNTGTSQNIGGNPSGDLFLTRIYGVGGRNSASVDIFNPQLPIYTTMSGTWFGTTSGDGQHGITSGVWNNTNQFDGLYIYPTGENITGTIMIYGYND